MRMLDRIDDRLVQTKTMHVFYNFVKPFHDPIRESVVAQQQTFRLGMDTGDLEYAAWALHSMISNAMYRRAFPWTNWPQPGRTTCS